MSLDIAIKVNPGDSAAKIKGVETELAAAEAKGKSAGQAMLGVSKAFQALGEAVKREQSALQRTSEIHRQLTAQASPLAQGFARIADAIKRERDMLDSIHGPIQRAAQDIQTLNSLLAKGAISAGEFNAKLAAIRPPRVGGSSGAGFDASSIAGSLPGGSIVAGAIGGGVAGAATAGIQTAIGGAGQIIAMADAYTGLNNRLKALTGSGSEATALFEKLHESANRTYSDVNTTTESFVKFSRALKGLGVSQNDTIAFTERLNQVIAMSGADATGANAAMLQLSQALSSGVLRGEEFNSIIEQAPALLDPIAKHLGVTVGQLRGLAQQGQITSKVIYDSFVEAGPAIEKAFGQSVPTVSQQMQVLKNDIGAMVGELAKSAELSKVTASVLSDLKTVIAATAEQTKLWSQGLNEVGLSFGDLASGGAGGFKALVNGFDQLIEGTGRAQSANVKYVDGIQVINQFVAAATGKMNEFAKAQTQNTLELTLGKDAAEAFAKTLEKLSKINTGWDVAKPASGLAAIYGELESVVLNTGRAIDKLGDTQKKHKVELSEEEKLLNRIRGPLYEQSKGLAVVALAYGRGTVTLAEYNTEVERLMKLAEKAPESLTNFGMIAPMVGVKELSTDTETNGGGVQKKALDAQKDLAKQARKEAASVEQAWAAAMGQVGGDFIKAAMEGEQSFGEMAENMMASIAKVILQMAALEMAKAGGTTGIVGTVLGGVIGGFATGGSFIVPGGPGPALPRAWSGNDWTVGGAGGTDSKMVSFMATPGERVLVQTPEQQRASGQGSGGVQRMQTIVQLQNDRRDLVAAIGSREGVREVVNIDRQMRQSRRR